MNNSVIALSIIFAVLLISSVIGTLAGRRHKMNLEQWAIGGRSFGLILVWLLMAGEAYTTSAFLGCSGWAYSRGGPSLYLLTYPTLAFVVSFFFLPQVWEIGKKFGMQTQSDFFRHRYGSKNLAAFVSLVGVIFMIPYLQMQLTGLGIIVEIAGFGGLSRPAAMIIAFVLVAAFVFISGVRAVAWISVIKDLMMLFVIFFIGIGLPYMYFGGIGKMFTALANAHPAHLTLPGATKSLGHSWYISTVLLTSLGYYMWPHLFSATFTAKSGNTVRKNAIVMPLYTMTILLVFFAGFTAFLVIPNLSNGDLSLLTIVRQSYPAWFLGIIGAAGVLTAIVPAAILILAASTLVTKNFYKEIFSPNMTDQQVVRMARWAVIVITLIALYFAIFSSTTLVNLILIGYAGIAQFLPGVLLGLYWSRVTKTGVAAGLVISIAVVSCLVLTGRDPFHGINAGFIALCINFFVTIIISLTTPEEANQFEKVFSPKDQYE